MLDAGEELEILARNRLAEAILATPALVDGKIHVRTESHLYAFGNQHRTPRLCGCYVRATKQPPSMGFVAGSFPADGPTRRIRIDGWRPVCHSGRHVQKQNV